MHIDGQSAASKDCTTTKKSKGVESTINVSHLPAERRLQAGLSFFPTQLDILRQEKWHNYKADTGDQPVQ
jgi:hypothetical protein